MASTYDIGDVVRLSAGFVQTTAIDPGTVALTVQAPDATSTTYTFALSTVTKDSTGNYHVDITPTQTGTYRYRWVSTGNGAAAEEKWFQVRTKRVS